MYSIYNLLLYYITISYYRFTYPQYPDTCTDDWIDMNITYKYGHTDAISPSTHCYQLLWPKHLDRSKIAPFAEIPYTDQTYYWPDEHYGPYASPNDSPLPPGYDAVNIPRPYV